MVPMSLVPPQIVVQPSLFLRRVPVMQVHVVVAVPVAVPVAVVVAVVPKHGVVEATRRQQRQPRKAHGQR